MNYTTLVDDFVALLQPLTTGNIEVERLPESQAEFTAPFIKPRITVAFKRSQAGNENIRVEPKTQSVGEYVADEFAEVHVLYRSRTLWDEDNGVYAVVAKAKKLLYGAPTTDWTRILFREFALEENDRDNGVWLAVMIFTCTARAVQNLADDAGTVYPAITEILHEFTIT